MRSRLLSLVVAAAAAGGVLVAVTGSDAGAHQSAASPPSAGAMPSAVPKAGTPSIDDGQVSALAQVGNTIIAGGTFTSVNSAAHKYLTAFDATTGALLSSFSPVVDQPVSAVQPGPTPNTAYIAGTFTQVDGVAEQFVAEISTVDGSVVTSFKGPVFNWGGITDLAASGGRLYAAGTFTKANTVAHGGLVSLNASTGALDPFVGIQLTGHHNQDSGGAQGPVGGEALDINSAGTRLVLIGNFQYAAGLLREQLALIDLTGSTAQVMPNWATTRYTPTCKYTAFDVTVRDVSFSPDGSYFVVSSTGGDAGSTLCDTATRWDPAATGSDIQPTWIQPTGRDTTWGVTVTDDAVYVGGHNRWANNPLGLDTAAPGSVPRAGLMALDPISGRPLAWNPGRVPLGTSVYAILATSAGVWIGSDTKWVGNYKYLRPRVAFFPYAGDSQASTQTAVLPGTVVLAGSKVAAPTNVLYRVDAGGPTIQSADNGPDWAADTAATSPYRNASSTTSSYTAVRYLTSAVPANTPPLLYDSERFDPPAGSEMEWKFKVAVGTSVQVRLYLSNRSALTAGAGKRKFNVTINGQSFLAGYDPYADAGDQTGTMKAFTVTVPSTGLVDILFQHVANASNPDVNGIELIDTNGPPATTGGSSAASGVPFDGTTAGAAAPIDGGPTTWAQARGAFQVGNTVFYGSTDGYLYKVSYTYGVWGSPVRLDPYNDPAWDGVLTGDKDTTFDGWRPDFYDQLPNVTGMTYSGGRIYYTLYNDPALHSVWFAPDSGIVDELSATTPSSVSFANADGMFVSGGSLYYATTDGNLNQVAFSPTGVTGGATVVNGPSTGGTNWSNRVMFLRTS